MLPIVQRELQTAARSQRLYKGRFRFGLAALLLILAILAFGKGQSRTGTLFESLAHLALILCLFEGVRKTADTISVERREGTLGLLFLSTLSGFDIIFGKLVSASIRSLSTLLAFVPIFSVTLLLGGTTGGEFWRTILVLTLALPMSLSLCLALSTFYREGAVVAALVVLSALALVPFVSAILPSPATPWILPVSPFYTMQAATDGYYSRSSFPFWLGVGYLGALTFLSLLAASVALPHFWQDKPVLARQTSRPISPKWVQRRRAMLDRNPVMGLMFDPRAFIKLRVFVILVTAFVVLGSASLWYFLPQFGIQKFEGAPLTILPLVALAVIMIVVSTRVAAATSRNFAEARASGEFERLPSTPLQVKDITRGQWLALKAEMMETMVVSIILCVLVLAIDIWANGSLPLGIAYFLLSSACSIVALGWLGIWMGLTSTTPGRAFGKTIIYGGILPYFLLCIPSPLIHGVLAVISTRKVNSHLRRFVAERYFGPPQLAPVLTQSSDTPPVLRG